VRAPTLGINFFRGRGGSREFLDGNLFESEREAQVVKNEGTEGGRNQ